MERRRFDFQEALAIEKVTETLDDDAPRAEHGRGLVIRDEVHVAAAIPDVDVGEAVPLVGQRAQRLRQELESVDLHRELALAGGHHGAFGADPVAEIEVGKVIEPLVTDDGLGDEELQLARAIAQGGEDQLALLAQQHRPPRDADPDLGLDARLECSVPVADLRQCVRAVEAVRIRLAAVLAHFVDLGEALRPFRLEHGLSALSTLVVRIDVRSSVRVVAHRTREATGQTCRR